MWRRSYEKDSAVPSDRLHKKKSEIVETDLLAAADPISKGIPAKIRMMIRLILFCIISKSADIDINFSCML